MLNWLIVLIVIAAEALLKLDEILINFLALLNKHLMRQLKVNLELYHL
jgi:hypothetical protein